VADLLMNIPLANGLTISVYDHNRHYYGDYFLVKLEFVCPVALSDSYFTDAASYDEARRLLGETVTYRRHVEQMGVPATEIERVRDRLIANFMDHSLSYFSIPEFPKRFVMAQLAKRQRVVGRSVASTDKPHA
jgi:hypothetical protein